MLSKRRVLEFGIICGLTLLLIISFIRFCPVDSPIGIDNRTSKIQYNDVRMGRFGSESNAFEQVYQFYQGLFAYIFGDDCTSRYGCP